MRTRPRGPATPRALSPSTLVWCSQQRARALLDGSRADSGAVTLFVAVAMVGLLALAGLVVDGGAKVRAAQHADRVAAEAARAAGQAVDLTALMSGQGVQVDRGAALAAARRYLHSTDVAGSAEVGDGGTTLRVTTRVSRPTVLLGLIGVTSLSASGQAEVRLTTQQEAAR